MPSVAASPLWDFALALWAEPGVAEGCVDLQDNQGVDVNLLLFAAWLSVKGIDLTEERLAQAIAEGHSWRESVITPLRQARRWIKTEATGAPGGQECRTAIKAAELEAEKVALGQLQSLAEKWPVASGDAALHNVERFLHALGLSAENCETGASLVSSALGRLLEGSGN